jgi:tRNA A-37 threonylcarbamoyl transferase component Bud32
MDQQSRFVAMDVVEEKKQPALVDRYQMVRAQLNQLKHRSGMKDPMGLVYQAIRESKFHLINEIVDEQPNKAAQLELVLSMAEMAINDASNYQWIAQLNPILAKWIETMDHLFRRYPCRNMHQHVASELLRQGWVTLGTFGAGGFGTVIQAKPVANENQDVAIKVVTIEDETDERRFIMEVAMHDIFFKIGISPMIYNAIQQVNPRRGYIVMEVKPQTLESSLFNTYENEPDDVVHMTNAFTISELNRLFDTMTQHHVIHADVKPDNITVDTHPDGTVSLLLLDLGWAYINHRAEPWSEWLWFAVTVLNGIVNKVGRIQQGIENLWTQMWADARVRASVIAAMHTFFPHQPHFEAWANQQSAMKNYRVLHDKLVAAKDLLDQRMSREYLRFTMHCEGALLQSATAVHRQSAQRLLNGVVPANSLSLQSIMQKAQACVRKIRDENPHQFA